MNHSRVLGQLLLAAQDVTEEQLAGALREQRSSRERLGDILIRQGVRDSGIVRTAREGAVRIFNIDHADHQASRYCIFQIALGDLDGHGKPLGKALRRIQSIDDFERRIDLDGRMILDFRHLQSIDMPDQQTDLDGRLERIEQTGIGHRDRCRIGYLDFHRLKVALQR